MTPDDDVLRVEVTLPLEPAAAFAILVDELTMELARSGIRFEPGPQGRVLEDGAVVGRVLEWAPGARVALDWHPASWEPAATTRLDLRFEASGGGTRAALEHRGFGRLLGDGGEIAGWFGRQVAAPVMRSIAPRGFGDWVTDRRARRPSGAQAHATYREPVYHRPNFLAILGELALGPDDYLVEVGCGGGALLADALRSGCRAAAVDHSGDMVRVARETNRDAIAGGRLTIDEASADHLPFADDTFTCAVMTGVFGFLPDPIAALAELRRVLAPGGRLVVMGTDPAWRDTPAAPEPMASRLAFLADGEFERAGRDAGFSDAHVERIPLDAFAREVGVPAEALPLFDGPGAPFLMAKK